MRSQVSNSDLVAEVTSNAHSHSIAADPAEAHGPGIAVI